MNENNNPTNLNGNIPYPNQPDPNTMNNINNPSNISPSIDNPIPTRSDIYQTNYSTNPFDSNQNTSMNQPMTASNTTSTNYNLGVNNNPMTQGQTNVEEPLNQGNNNFNNNVPVPPININTPPSSIPEEDNTFTEPKKKHIGGIIAVLLLLLIIGGGLYYYFIYDNPKKIFNTYTDALFNSASKYVDIIDKENTLEQYNIRYNIDLDLITSDEELKPLYDIVNDLTFKGNYGYSKNENIGSIILNTTYKDTSLPTIHSVVELKDNGSVYLYAKDLYSKAIKVDDTTTSTPESSSNIDTNVNDYKIVLSETINTYKEVLSTATYKKEYTKLNDKYVKKVSIIIDKAFTESIITKLMNNEKYLNSYAKVMGLTLEEVKSEYQDELSNLTDNYEELSLYLDILNNNFIMVTLDAGSDGILKITKDKNTYNFEYSEEYTLKYQGSITINTKTDKELSLSLELGLLEDETTIKLNMSTEIDTTIGYDKISTNETVSLEDLSESDLMKIMESFMSNEAISQILSDTGLDKYLASGSLDA